MATFTQDKQPYGPLHREEHTVDGVRYAVRCDPTQYFPGRYRWELRPAKGGERIAYCDLPIASGDMRQAVKRLLGID